MHVVVVGCGRVGSTVARELSANGHEVVVIDKKAEAFRRLGTDWGGRTIVGIGFDRQVLTSAGLDAASGVLAVTNGDNTNILVARVARETFGAERVVARIYDPTRARIYERLGIPTVASVTWTAARALRLLHAEVAQPDWVDPTAAFSLVEMTVARGGAGRRFDSLEACGARAMLLRRNGVASIPGADGLMQEADQVHVIVPAGAVAAAHRAVGMDEEVPVMKVVIAGAGSVGRYMAGQLHASGHEVVLVDTIASVFDRLSPSLESIGRHLGDACETATLAAVGAGDADVVAAVTGDDEDNLVISLLAKQEFAVPRVVARANNPNNEWMFNEMWGVDMSVSTPHLLTALVEEAVTEGELIRLMALEHGKAQLAEVTLAAASPGIGKEIAQLGLPRESTVVAVLRDGHVVVPRPDTVLQRGDEVIVLVTGDAEAEVRHQLVG